MVMVRFIEFSESQFGFEARDSAGQVAFVDTGKVLSNGRYEGFSCLTGDKTPMAGSFDTENYRMEIAKLMGF